METPLRNPKSPEYFDDYIPCVVVQLIYEVCLGNKDRGFLCSSKHTCVSLPAMTHFYCSPLPVDLF